MNARAAGGLCPGAQQCFQTLGPSPSDGHHTETLTQLPAASNVRPALSPQTRKILPEKAAGSKIFLVCGLGIPFPLKSSKQKTCPTEVLQGNWLFYLNVCFTFTNVICECFAFLSFFLFLSLFFLSFLLSFLP